MRASVEGVISGRCLCLFLICVLLVLPCAGGCIESERQALLAVKKSLVDPGNKLASWTSADKDCCRWSRVGCDNLTGHVIKLDLHRVKSWDDLDGEISPSLLQLPFLSHLDLSYNAFLNVSKVISSLGRLKYLDMSVNKINTFPYHLGNLTTLEYLDLSSNDFTMRVVNCEWLARLSSLQFLQLSYINFTEAEDWYQAIKVHPSLSTLNLYRCDFPKINSSSVSFFNSSNSLVFIYLEGNSFDSSTLPWLFNLSTALVDFQLVLNDGLDGPIPNSVGDLIWLEHLDLKISIEGGIPTSFQKLCHLKVLNLSNISLSEPLEHMFEKIGCAKNSLEELNLSGNKLTGSIPDISEFKSLRTLDLSDNLLNGTFCERLDNFSKLVTLSVKSNQLIGPLPDFEKLPSLVDLDVSNNSLNGNIPVSIGKLPNLTVLDMSSNSLDGVVTETHLASLSKLNVLDVSCNSLTFKINSIFVPSFQLDNINLRSCTLGPKFPNWLQNQKKFSIIDISDSQISDIVPQWFWNLPPGLVYLNLSLNHMYGQIPNLSTNFDNYPGFDLSSNNFDGSIPQFFFSSSFLSLHNNSFSGSLSSLCALPITPLMYLDLSYNFLSGSLTDCWSNLPGLNGIILESNNFSGTIPSSFGSLFNLMSLHLSNNALTGKLPESLKNCSVMLVLDVGDNHLIGELPAWIGESLTNLIVLRLRSNRFHGKINPAICQLSNIRILDISFNNFSGAIPACVNNFTSLSSNKYDYPIIPSCLDFISPLGVFFNFVCLTEVIPDYASVLWKGFKQEYRRTLGLLKLIDLSSNNLIGDIPIEITNLSALISLNVSRNNFSGLIPDNIGQLKELEALDFSHNQISGKIPSSLIDIHGLGVLDLSYNKLSGKIPKGTQLQSFDPSAYMGNPGLCGCPLLIKCQGDDDECLNNKRKQEPSDSSTYKDNTKEELLDGPSFYAGMGIGFATSFSAFCSLLIMNRSWRQSYLRVLNDLENFLYLIIVLKVARRGFNSTRS